MKEYGFTRRRDAREAAAKLRHRPRGVSVPGARCGGRKAARAPRALTLSRGLFVVRVFDADAAELVELEAAADVVREIDLEAEGVDDV